MASVAVTLLGRDRAAFLPDVVWRSDGGEYARIDRHTDHAAWRDAADADCPLVTQWDDGADENSAGKPTCSLSLPTAVRRMLDACDIRPGQRVLEVGTGCGYTAALLKDRVGPEGSVTSVEVDPVLAAAARERLDAAGVAVDVVRGDGLKGWETSAPYDRVHVTCGIRRLPSAWLRQCPDGVLVLPWGSSHEGRDNRLVTLTVSDGVAVGPIGASLWFMEARSQRPVPWGEWPDTGAVTKAELPVSWREIDAAVTDADRFVLGLLLPGTRLWASGHTDDEDGRVAWLERAGEYASVGFGWSVPTTVAGDGRLAEDFARAVRWWHDHDRPPADGFGLRVTPDGEFACEEVWFGSPDAPVRLR
ncbi:methyltransferase domain-containing protein [Yinghuangia sp. ASG 101]|uniref:protein-L-isoaspartate O-methyltransferase family protein n=1 Tax=Yinghuangia sp. ASG 101 TaxID=2896848 RepID=UPI001E65DA60|nr:methyltransferase domain-containing protein [Yinghuangia sp. ASG 101]UGQ09426.1 methyltransferase domain-containing protein [Yinghuangia sp. ASG 101]